MNPLLRSHADQIVREAIAAVQPDEAVRKALQNREFPGRVLLVSGEELQDITSQLLACGADIVEMNTIRKRLSQVKGGQLAICA